jgi:hypothetical protein
MHTSFTEQKLCSPLLLFRAFFVKGRHFILFGVRDITDVTQNITSFPISLHTQNFTKEIVPSYTLVNSDSST